MEKLFTTLRFDKRLRNLILIGILLIGIILTISVINITQQLNSKASEDTSAILLSPNSQFVKKGDPFLVKVLFESKGKNIMGADITIKYDPALLSLESFESTREFTDVILRSIDEEKGEIRLVLAETEDKSHNEQILNLGALSFKANENGNANVAISNAQIVALGSNNEITLGELPQGIYTISETGNPPSSSDSLENSADLVPVSFQLTDAQGNVKDTFNPGEQIYTLITLTNKGTKQTLSDSGYVYSYIYPDSPTALEVNTTPTSNMYLRNGLFSPEYTKTYGSFPEASNIAQYRGDKFFTNNTVGIHTARLFMNYDHKATENNFDNNQLTVKYLIRKPTPEGKACASVITPARNLQTNECWSFTDSCLPDGWIQDVTCASSENKAP